MDYAPIQCNIYLCDRIASKESDQEGHCYCHRVRELSRYCGSECMNRLSKIECDDSNCLCQTYCTNRSFTAKKQRLLEVVKTASKGDGLITLLPISEGDFVIQYIGEVYALNTPYGEERFQRNKENKELYMMEISKGVVIDASKQGNLSRFINHSCEPNCRVEKWIVKGEPRLGIFALRDIYQYQELSYDYRQCFWQQTDFSCSCSTPSCLFKEKPSDHIQLKLKVKIGHLMYLREKYEFYVNGTPSTIRWDTKLVQQHLQDLAFEVEITISGNSERVLQDKNVFKRLKSVECMEHLACSDDAEDIQQYLAEKSIFFMRSRTRSQEPASIFIMGLSSEMKQIKNFLKNFKECAKSLPLASRSRMSQLTTKAKAYEQSETANISELCSEEDSPFPQEKVI